MTREEIDEELYQNHFRVTIFGSARIKKDNPAYQQVYILAKMIAKENIDVVTGGGPGLMQAASEGHRDGRIGNDSHTIGLNIKIPTEQKMNRHFDIKSEFDRFSHRLDAFKIIKKFHEGYLRGDDICMNFKKYKSSLREGM